MLSKHLDSFFMEEYINTPTDPFLRELNFFAQGEKWCFFKDWYNIQCSVVQGLLTNITLGPLVKYKPNILENFTTISTVFIKR